MASGLIHKFLVLPRILYSKLVPGWPAIMELSANVCSAVKSDFQIIDNGRSGDRIQSCLAKRALISAVCQDSFDKTPFHISNCHISALTRISLQGNYIHSTGSLPQKSKGMRKIVLLRVRRDTCSREIYFRLWELQAKRF